VTIPTAIANTIVDPKAYSAGAPLDAAFDMLRRDMPLERAAPDEIEPFWAVTRQADIMAIEGQPAIFRNGDRPTVLSTKEGEAFVRNLTGGEANLIRSLVSVDGEEHKALRGVGFPAFVPKKVGALEEDIRVIAREFVDRMVAMGPECDFAKDVAFLYPLRVIMTVLGVPREDEPFMLKLTQELFNSSDPDLARDAAAGTNMEIIQSLVQTMMDLENYFEKVTTEFRAHPRDVVNSVIANAMINGEYLNRRQLMGYYIIAATAGHDTTSNTIAAGFWALAERPDVFRQLKHDPSLTKGFIEESIRWATPVKHFMRSAAADAEIAGRKIAKDDWLMLSYHSASRDEAVFDKPYEFDITRQFKQQISFGYGPHVCLGQHLARLEMRILAEEIMQRIGSIELAGTPQRTQSNFVCGPKSVPVRFTLN
jgi:cytochrome P450